MRDKGSRAAVRASAILLGAALLRSLFTPSPGGPGALPTRASIADSLAGVGDSIATDRELRSRPLDPGEKLDPNRATEVDLDRLPGIGPTKAARIVADRDANGPFRVLEDLARVPGLGARSLERLGPFISLPSTAEAGSGQGAKGGSEARRLLGVEERPAAASSLSTVRLNSATKDELESLPGIGPVLAQRIVDFRDARGGFRTARELIEVPGVGPTTFARLRSMVSVP